MAPPLMTRERVGTKRTDLHAGGVPQKYILDERGRRLLIETYDSSPERITWLSQQLGVPRWRVTRWASHLGLARVGSRRWTREEVSYLEKHLHKQGIKSIAKHLDRTPIAVKLKAESLHLNKCFQEGYTLGELSRCLGCGPEKIRGWIARSWLKGHKRHTERPLDVWLFTDRDIRAFVIAHPNEVNPRRMDWLWMVDLLGGDVNGGIGELAKMRGEREEA